MSLLPLLSYVLYLLMLFEKDIEFGLIAFLVSVYPPYTLKGVVCCIGEASTFLNFILYLSLPLFSNAILDNVKHTCTNF